MGVPSDRKEEVQKEVYSSRITPEGTTGKLFNGRHGDLTFVV